MFKANLLKAKLVENGISAYALCDKLDINETTFYRKMARNGSFSRGEIEKITEILKLSPTEKDDIFFATPLT